MLQISYCYTLYNKIINRSSISACINCITRSIEFALDCMTYEIVKHVSNSTFNKFVVTYDAISCEVKCQCLLFESRGILCHHSLSALIFERVHKVAPRYILERWSKNVKRKRTHIKSSHDEPLLESRKSEELTAILHHTYRMKMLLWVILTAFKTVTCENKRTC
ncbi:hypothetical protein Ahy_A02g010092 [Arachis hypogaea]|uniref:Protein FAR1-RELATED SEQUENCE n=1 Tax=Arachis hypogaea TaxID=3818 RepID=A0A445EJB9_ARAHY|nr:hypothetical protein Ahy_A02g010092 [Arachis hypogaea]